MVLRDRLKAAGSKELQESLARYEGEFYFLSPMHTIWRAYNSRPDIREAYPDPLYVDAPRFLEWLRLFGTKELRLTDACVAAFSRSMNGHSMARVFSFVNRAWWVMREWPLGLVGEGRDRFARALLLGTVSGPEHQLDDVVTYLWTMDYKPWAGIPYVFELRENLRRSPSPRLKEGQAALLKSVLDRSPEWRLALDAYQARYCSGPQYENLCEQVSEEPLERRRPVEVAEFLKFAPPGPPPRRNGSGRAGANIFGFFKSPIGLGTLSRGMAGALRGAGYEVRENVVGNVAMCDSLAEEDLVQRFDHRLDTNLFISYPHSNEPLLTALPAWMVESRRNIAYLAWEQKEGNELWAEMYRDMAQVWAISDFAARGLERCLRRPVKTVPGVVDFESLPEPALKAAAGLPPDKFAFVTVFDPNSSIERKNPEAVVRAFEAAFDAADDAVLAVRVANWWRPEHRRRLREFLGALRRLGSRALLFADEMTHAQVLKLISASDCYVSLHRAEGFGYTCAEAMSYGRPVIATRYSGNLDFMTDEDSYLVSAREVDVTIPDGPFSRGSVWAEPDEADAVARMQEVYKNRTESLARGRLAAANVRKILSPQIVGERMMSYLREGD